MNSAPTAADCTILVASCDPYSDLHRPFLVAFRRHWPDCPWPVVLLTETVCGAAGFDRVISTGKGKCWSEMMAEALRQIATPYVVLMMDDYLLSASVDGKKVAARFAQAREFDAANLRLVASPKGGRPFRGTDLLECPKNTAYCVSCQVGFWARDYLLGLVERTKSAWEFEREGSFMVGGETRPILHTTTLEFPFVDSVHKGCWERAGLATCRANGIEPDLARRGLPSLGTRTVELVKKAIFALFPWTLIVRVQNALGAGAKERK